MKKNFQVASNLWKDANESIFFARQLEHIYAEIEKVEYQTLKSRTLIPVDTSVSNEKESYTYRVFDRTGMAAIVSDYAHDFPRVDLLAKEVTAKIKSLGASFGYSIQEIRAAQATGTPLTSDLADAAQESILIREDNIAWFGDTTHNLSGFLSNANIPEVVLPADGTGASKLWSTKSPDQIVRDLNLVVNTIVETTKGIEQGPFTLLLPIAKFTYIASTRMGDGSDTTILKFFMMNNPFIASVDWLNELKDLGAGTTDRMVVYRKDRKVLMNVIPQDVEMFPPQEEMLAFKVPVHSRHGGVALKRPLSTAFADGF